MYLIVLRTQCLAMINLYDHQIKAIDKLRSGSILLGGTGSGKSITALAYFIRKEVGGEFESSTTSYKKPKISKHLYIVTTAKKRDSLEWERDASNFLLSKEFGNITIDSWNNIKKYVRVTSAFFIFDEQRVIGTGTWVKSFIKISKSNRWILLSATPGDVWLDYAPVFIANGFYKNVTEFKRRHVVYNSFTKYPKVDRYVETGLLMKYRNSVVVNMPFRRHTKIHDKYINVKFDVEQFNRVLKDRWNIYKEKPVKEISELCYTLRRVVNSNPDRLKALTKIGMDHAKIIIFYNFNYELDILLKWCENNNIPHSQLNGHKHEEIPKTDRWLYIVQYAAGSEAWNCIETDTIVFYSQNYSYRTMKQSAGRIDRLNTPYTDLYLYHLVSNSFIDNGIRKSLSEKKNFNEKKLLA